MPASKTEDRNLKTTFLPDWRLRVTVQLSTALGHTVKFHTKRTCNSPKTWTRCTFRRQATRTRAPYRHSCCICLVPCFSHSQCGSGHDGENARHLLLLRGKGLVCVFLFNRQHHVLARATKQCSWCINLTACSSHTMRFQQRAWKHMSLFSPSAEKILCVFPIVHEYHFSVSCKPMHKIEER